MIVVPFSLITESGEYREDETVVAIGVFDGVHQGHKAIFERLVALKRELGAKHSAAITFSTNPKGRRGELDTPRLRAGYIESFGVDILAVIDFSAEFSMISACGFASLLRKAFKPVGAVVGKDFRFGNPSSQGSGEDLSPMLRSLGVECRTEIVDSVLDSDGIRISSTRLRQMIEKGDLGCFLSLSGQSYRVDLVPFPYRSCSDGLIYSKASIHQLLPPPGAYDADLATTDGKRISCITWIDEEFLHISFDTGSSAIGSDGMNGKEAMQIDSLFLEKKR